MTQKDYDERLNKLEENSQQTLNVVTELKLGLLGSEKLKLKGVIHKVQDHEEYIEKDKKKKNQLVGAISVISFIFGIAGSFLFKLIFGK